MENGQEMYRLIERLYPICRSITGDGVRKTLSIIGEHIPLKAVEVPSGTQVFDWTVPKEWNIKGAYIADSEGRKIVDWNDHNLHVVSYSVPVDKKMPLAELKNYLHSLPEHPDWIPYRTSYYNESWGFCLSHNLLNTLKDGEYHVRVDSTLKDGSLTYGEYHIKGREDREILLFAHICHPSLCNDNLSGIALLVQLAKYLSGRENRYSYRFVFAPATIGSITWLSRNENQLDKIHAGLVTASVGDNGQLTYKKSRDGGKEIDQAVLHTLKHSGFQYDVNEFTPYGYDERQFCSQGINLAVGRLTRTPNGGYPEYHTSADNLQFVDVSSLEESYQIYEKVLTTIENNVRYTNALPKCEPQLGKRGLYRKMGGYQGVGNYEYAMFWVLNYSDGSNTLLDIAVKADMPFEVMDKAANDLLQSQILEIS